MSEAPPAYPSFREALRYWFRLGWISFGGPAGQIALLHRELVEQRRWFSHQHFMEALHFCMILPGPEAQQLATYLGWRLHGWRGGLAAGSLFVLPSAGILLGLSWLYMAGGHLAWLGGIFHGLTAAVIATVAEAVWRIGRQALRSPSLWALAGLSFAALSCGKVSFILILLAAGLVGGLGHRRFPQQFPASGRASKPHEISAPCLILPPCPTPSPLRSARVLALCLSLWWIPILATGLWQGWHSTAFHQGVFFSQAALVTFGGAYAVLPYVAQQAVEHYHWLSHSQMMSGLALAETTPGPLIMVLQFVGFVGGWQHPGALSALSAATLGAFLTTWATFAPCFLWVFLGAPHIGKLHQRPALSAALAAVTAAVVGVILHLGTTFASHALLPRPGGAFDPFIAVLAPACFLALHRYKVPLLPLLALAALLGLLHAALPALLHTP